MDEKRLFRKVGNEFSARTDGELSANTDLGELLWGTIKELGPKWDMHLPVFLSASSLARILWLDFVYQKAIDVPGQLAEFGSQWGSSLNVFLLLKLIREPWNAGRKINSFSTFSAGFVSIDPKDGNIGEVRDYAVKEGWGKKLG